MTGPTDSRKIAAGADPREALCRRRLLPTAFGEGRATKRTTRSTKLDMQFLAAVIMARPDGARCNIMPLSYNGASAADPNGRGRSPTLSIPSTGIAAPAGARCMSPNSNSAIPFEVDGQPSAETRAARSEATSLLSELESEAMFLLSEAAIRSVHSL